MPRILCANDHVKADDGLPCERCEQIRQEQEAEPMEEACGCQVSLGKGTFPKQTILDSRSIRFCHVHDPQTVAGLIAALHWAQGVLAVLSRQGRYGEGWVVINDALRRVEGRA